MPGIQPDVGQERPRIDGSRDKTGEIVAAIAAKDCRVRLVQHSKNLGYGAALFFGIGFGLVGAVLFFFREVLKSVIIILQSIPSIAWVPLFLIMMGFGNLPIIIVVALSAFFPAALSVMNADGTKNRFLVEGSSASTTS